VAIAHEASTGLPGGTSQGSTSISVAYVGTPSAGDLGLLVACVKPETATFDAVSGWTLVGTATGGTGSSGVDVGPTRLGVWTRELDGTESGSVTVTNTGGNSSAGAMTVLTKDASATWDYSAFVTGDDAAHDTSASAACGTWPSALAANDWVTVAHACDTDLVGLASSFAITQSGATFGTFTLRNRSRSGTNNDCGVYSIDVPVTTGSANAPTFTATCSNAECGPYLLLRVREVASGGNATPTLPEQGTGAEQLSVAVSGAASKTLAEASSGAQALSVAMAGAAGGWTTTVEVAWTTQPMSSSPVWTDESVNAEPDVEITDFGRTDEFTDMTPTRLRLRFKNPAGRYTMGNTSSPLSPNVKVGKRLRVTQTYKGVAYQRFDGHSNGWPAAWLAPGGTAGVADVAAVDRGKRLGRPGLLRSMLEEETLRDSPGGYWPLGEPAGAASAASVTQVPQAAMVLRSQGSGGTVDFGSGTGPGTDELPAPAFTPASPVAGQYLVAQLAAPVGGPSGGRTLSAWMRTNADEGVTVTSRVVAALVDSAGNALTLSVNEFGEAEAAGVRAAGTETYAIAWSTDVNDGRTHHLAVTESISGSTVTARLYVDGSQRATTTFSSTALPTGRFVHAGYWKSNPSSYGIFAGTLAHVAAFPTAVSATRLAAHYAAGATGFAGERTDQRLTRIADWVGLPAADRAFDVGDGTVGAQATSGKQALEAMREVAHTESGVLFFTGSGVLTFHRRSRRYNRTVDLTLPASVLDADLVFPGDDFGLVNDFEVTRPGGAGGRAVDQASIDDFTLYRDADEIISDSDTAAQAAADWRVGNYATPRPGRTPNVTVEIAKVEREQPSLVAGILAATVGTKLRLTGLPASAPASTVDLYIEGWSETISPESWRITFNTSPGDLDQVWQLGVSGLSELGVTTRLGQ
jgi:hypothetical protein